MRCPRCGKISPNDRQFCQYCLLNIGDSKYVFNTNGTNGAAQRREWDKDKHAKDIIQPFMKDKPNPEFIKAYGDDKELLDNYYTKEELKKNE